MVLIAVETMRGDDKVVNETYAHGIAGCRYLLGESVVFGAGDERAGRVIMGNGQSYCVFC